MRQKNTKIIKYRKQFNLNFSTVIFLFLFLYIVAIIVTYVLKDKVSSYEIVEGATINENSYTGVILRDEVMTYTDMSGYVSYYLAEGSKARVGTTIYTVDQTGIFAEVLNDVLVDNNIVSQDSLNSIKEKLLNFTTSYSSMNFGEVQDMEYDLKSIALQELDLKQLESLSDKITESNFQKKYASQSGIVVYCTDPLDGLTEDAVTADTFNEANNVVTSLKSVESYEQGAPVYKTITENTWKIVFPIAQENVQNYQDTTSLKVRLIKKNIDITLPFSLITGADGNTYGKLTMTKYLSLYAKDRFVEFEIASKQTKGLKIPVASVLTKTFSEVPVDCLSYQTDTEDNKVGFYRQITLDDGTIANEFISPDIAYSTKDYYYIDPESLAIGDVLMNPLTGDLYTVENSKDLTGVYNINAGYAIFKCVEIMEQAGDYYIISSDLRNSVNMYDHIALEAYLVKEGELVY